MTLRLWLGRAFRDIKGKLYPSVCFDVAIEGGAIEATFRDDDLKEFLFKGPYDGETTLEEPIIEAEKEEEIEVPQKTYRIFKIPCKLHVFSLLLPYYCHFPG